MYVLRELKAQVHAMATTETNSYIHQWGDS